MEFAVTRQIEITDVYQIGTTTYQDVISVELDEDGILIHPLKIYKMTDTESVFLGEEENTHTILKAAAIALAESILDYYNICKDDD
jgi:predicted ATP-grasp superfamily ATP-dependent carboligase